VTWPHRDEVRSSLKNLEGARASPDLSGSLIDEYMLSMRIREYSLNTRYLPEYSLFTRYLPEYSLFTRILAIYPNTRYLHEYSLSTRVHAELESYPPRVHQSYARIERSILFKSTFFPFLLPSEPRFHYS